MDKIVEYVVEKTGLSSDMAEMAVKAALTYIKKGTPDIVDMQIDKMLDDDSGKAGKADSDKGQMGGLLDAGQGLFGKK